MTQSVIEQTAFSKPVNGPLFSRMRFREEVFGTKSACGNFYTHFEVISQSKGEISFRVNRSQSNAPILKDLILNFSLDIEDMQTVTLSSGDNTIDVDALPELMHVLLEKFMLAINHHYGDAFTHRQGLYSELKIKTK